MSRATIIASIDAGIANNATGLVKPIHVRQNMKDLANSALMLEDVGTTANTVAAGNDSRITGSVQKSGSDLTGGFTATFVNDGTKSSGTYTPTPVGGNYKSIINGGAFTLAAPTANGDYDIAILVVNNASAGAVTLSGFTKTGGDSLTTTNGHSFFLNIRKLNNVKRLYIEALQ